MTHSLIDYKDLGFKAALAKSQHDNRTRKDNRALFLQWLKEEPKQAQHEASKAYYEGLEQFYTQQES